MSKLDESGDGWGWDDDRDGSESSSDGFESACEGIDANPENSDNTMETHDDDERVSEPVVDWTLLPGEIVLSIFAYLDPKSLARAMRVCTRWRAAAETDRLWEAHVVAKWGRKEEVCACAGYCMRAVRVRLSLRALRVAVYVCTCSACVCVCVYVCAIAAIFVHSSRVARLQLRWRGAAETDTYRLLELAHVVAKWGRKLGRRCVYVRARVCTFATVCVVLREWRAHPLASDRVAWANVTRTLGMNGKHSYYK